MSVPRFQALLLLCQGHKGVLDWNALQVCNNLQEILWSFILCAYSDGLCFVLSTFPDLLRHWLESMGLQTSRWRGKKGWVQRSRISGCRGRWLRRLPWQRRLWNGHCRNPALPRCSGFEPSQPSATPKGSQRETMVKWCYCVLMSKSVKFFEISCAKMRKVLTSQLPFQIYFHIARPLHWTAFATPAVDRCHKTEQYPIPQDSTDCARLTLNSLLQFYSPGAGRKDEKQAAERAKNLHEELPMFQVVRIV